MVVVRPLDVQDGMEPPTDLDAIRAIEWVKRGKPSSDIKPDDDVPEQTSSELAEFKKCSYRKV